MPEPRSKAVPPDGRSPDRLTAPEDGQCLLRPQDTPPEKDSVPLSVPLSVLSHVLPSVLQPVLLILQRLSPICRRRRKN